MPVICADGIVTRYVNYKESDRILSIFTIDRGRLDAKARGCRKPRSGRRFAPQQAEGEPRDHQRAQRQHRPQQP